MAKRLRQTSLFETAKKRCEESSSVSVDRDQESPSTDSQLYPQSGIVRDETEPNAGKWKKLPRTSLLLTQRE